MLAGELQYISTVENLQETNLEFICLEICENPWTTLHPWVMEAQYKKEVGWMHWIVKVECHISFVKEIIAADIIR